MKLQEAIQIQQETYHQYEKGLLSKQRFAFKLGLEALKYVYRQYDPDHRMMRKLLPGETLH